VQLVEWDRTHQFCGRCATTTEPAMGERARRCPACGLLAFPRLAPAIITLIEPLLNPVWVFIFVGERPSQWAVLGGTIIVATVLIHTLVQYRGFTARA